MPGISLWAFRISQLKHIFRQHFNCDQLHFGGWESLLSLALDFDTDEERGGRTTVACSLGIGTQAIGDWFAAQGTAHCGADLLDVQEQRGESNRCRRARPHPCNKNLRNWATTFFVSARRALGNR